MRLVVAIVLVTGTSAVMVVAMLAARRRAPEGSRFSDGDRAAGFFGVVATGFALLLGFVIFLAFTTYDQSRAGAETEALAVLQQVETSQLLPVSVREELTGELICYGRSIVGIEWPGMTTSRVDPVNPWGIALAGTFATIEPSTPSEQSAYDVWLDRRMAREEGRRDRLHAAEGIVPLAVWLVLFLAAALVLGFVLFFADPAESALTQGMMAGAVTAMIVALLLLLAALDHPYQPVIGGLRPIAMERTLGIIDESLAEVGLAVDPPCDADGRPRG